MASVLCMLVVYIWTMKLNHDRVIMVANWQYCLAGKEIHMRVTEKFVKNPEEEGGTLMAVAKRRQRENRECD